MLINDVLNTTKITSTTPTCVTYRARGGARTPCRTQTLLDRWCSVLGEKMDALSIYRLFPFSSLFPLSPFNDEIFSTRGSHLHGHCGTFELTKLNFMP